MSYHDQTLQERLGDKICETSCIFEYPAIKSDDSFYLDSSLILEGVETGSQNTKDIFEELPATMKKMLLEYRGISRLFEWQKDCLKLPCIYNGGNLVYSSPTGGGKTLVSELILIREVIKNRKDAIYVVPYISLAHEKVSSLAPLGCALGFHVAEYAGSKGYFPPTKRFKRNSIYVATIEKATMLINSLTEEKLIHKLGVLVVDELHIINDGRRGVTLEVMLTKLLHYKIPVQIVGMSATLQNVKDLCSFVNASYFSSISRPVKLDEFLCVGSKLYQINTSKPDWKSTMNFQKDIQKRHINLSDNLDILIQLVEELNFESSCLIFCPSKKNCEITCENLSKYMQKSNVKISERNELIKALNYVSGGICPILNAVVVNGIGYHHAGMADDERKLIEEAFLCGTISILCCTSTLAAGVNLPAHRVIIKSPYVGSEFLKNTYYYQMIGRAGRPGFCSSGNSIIMVESKQLEFLDTIFDNKRECFSALSYSSNYELASVILSLISPSKSISKTEVIEFFSKTLLYIQLRDCEQKFEFEEKLEEAIRILKNENLINITSENGLVTFKITQYGEGVAKSGMDVKDYPNFYLNLNSALEKFVLSSDLHLLYMCAPKEVNHPIKNFNSIMSMLSGLTKSELELMSMSGLSEGLIYKWLISNNGVIKDTNLENIFKRWYLTLLLYQLYKGRSIWSVSVDFQFPRGSLQQILTCSIANAGILFRFSKEIKPLWQINILMEVMIKKLSAINSYDVLPLLEISGVKLGRAKQLFNCGYKTVKEIASASVEDLLKNISHISRWQASSIISSARLIVREQVECLRGQAEEILEGRMIDLGIN